MSEPDPQPASTRGARAVAGVRHAVWLAGPVAGGVGVASVGVAVGQPGAGAVAGILTIALVSLVRVLL